MRDSIPWPACLGKAESPCTVCGCSYSEAQGWWCFFTIMQDTSGILAGEKSSTTGWSHSHTGRATTSSVTDSTRSDQSPAHTESSRVSARRGSPLTWSSSTKLELSLASRYRKELAWGISISSSHLAHNLWGKDGHRCDIRAILQMISPKHQFLQAKRNG